MKVLKSWKKFNESRTRWQSDDSPINYNSGAYSFHLNFDIRDITNNNPFIYPGGEFTTSSEGNGLDLLEQFVQAIQKHDISEIKEFINGKKTLFDENKEGVSCGSNNLSMIEIPKEVYGYTGNTFNPDETNSIKSSSIEISKPITELEKDKIYTVFTFKNNEINPETSDFDDEFTGIIDVTEGVKKFIEMNKM